MNAAIGKYRWTICSLIFFATTINYLDRQVISLLKSTLSAELHWNDADYANIEIAFKLFYAFGMLGAGRLIDKLGTKLGYALATGLWSLAAVCHAFASSVFSFAVVRSFLGVTEAGNFPAAIKSVAEWFPKKERALATGIFNSGANFGAIIAPLTVPFIAAEWGWKWAFILTGLIGFIWLIFWFLLYEVPRKHKKLSEAEFEYIHSDKDEVQEVADEPAEKVSWFKLLGFRQTWAFAIGKLLTDPIWWFYLFWLPDFLERIWLNQNEDCHTSCACIHDIYCRKYIRWMDTPSFHKKGMDRSQSQKNINAHFCFLCITDCICAITWKY